MGSKKGFPPLPYIWKLLYMNQKSVCKKIISSAKQYDGGRRVGGTDFFGFPDGIRAMNPKELEMCLSVTVPDRWPGWPPAPLFLPGSICHGFI